MTQPNHLLAMDLGAESGRAILGTLDDGKLALAEIHRFPNVPVRLPDGLHWDILRLWTDIKDALALAIRKHGKQSLSIGVDTWGVDFGLLDRHGALIGNPYHYRDNRTDGMMDEAFRRMPREKIFELTGIQFMQLNTLYQLLAMVVGKSPALDSAETFLTIPDLLNYWLTGQIACEFSNATTTQCYDPRQRDWSASLLDAMNIPRRIFPRIIMPGTMLGALLPHVVRRSWRAASHGDRSGVPRHRLGGCGSSSPESRFRVDQFRHVVHHGRGTARAGHHSGKFAIQLYERRRRRRHVSLFQEHCGVVACARMSPRVGARRRRTFVRRADANGSAARVRFAR